MKKTIFSILILLIVSANFTNAQNKQIPNPNVAFCGATKNNDVIKYEDLLKCDAVTLPYKEPKIKSFSVSAMIPGEKAEENSMFVDSKNEGSKLSKESLDLIKRCVQRKGTKILIENVIVIETDGKSERKFEGISINLK